MWDLAYLFLCATSENRREYNFGSLRSCFWNRNTAKLTYAWYHGSSGRHWICEAYELRVAHVAAIRQRKEPEWKLLYYLPRQWFRWTFCHIHSSNRKPKLSGLLTQGSLFKPLHQVRIDTTYTTPSSHINSKMAQIRQILLIFLTSCYLFYIDNFTRHTSVKIIWGQKVTMLQTFRKLGLESSYGIQQRWLWRVFAPEFLLLFSWECPAAEGW